MKFKKIFQITSGIEKTTGLPELVKDLEEIYFKGDLVKIKIEVEIVCDPFVRNEEIDKYLKQK